MRARRSDALAYADSLAEGEALGFAFVGWGSTWLALLPDPCRDGDPLPIGHPAGHALLEARRIARHAAGEGDDFL